jgi:AraC family transcriptional regulator
MFVTRRAIGDFSLAEIRYEPHVELPRHEHLTAGFCLTFDGAYVESYGRTALDVERAVVTFSPAGEPHANRFSAAGAHCFTIDIATSWLARHESVALTAPARLTDAHVVRVARHFFGEMARFDDAVPLAAEGLALELIAASMRATGTRNGEPPWLRRVDEAIRAGFRGSIRTSELATIAGVHPVHLASVFRARRGGTIADAVRALRIADARERLARGSEPLAQIALACGFANQSHFAREFRRVTGVTPSAYRAQRLS